MTLRLPRDLWGVYRQPPQFRFGTVTSVSPGICTVQVAGGEIPVIYFKGAAPSVGDFVSVQRQSVVSYLMTAPSGAPWYAGQTWFAFDTSTGTSYWMTEPFMGIFPGPSVPNFAGSVQKAQATVGTFSGFVGYGVGTVYVLTPDLGLVATYKVPEYQQMVASIDPTRGVADVTWQQQGTPNTLPPYPPILNQAISTTDAAVLASVQASPVVPTGAPCFDSATSSPYSNGMFFSQRDKVVYFLGIPGRDGYNFEWDALDPETLDVVSYASGSALGTNGLSSTNSGADVGIVQIDQKTGYAWCITFNPNSTAPGVYTNGVFVVDPKTGAVIANPFLQSGTNVLATLVVNIDPVGRTAFVVAESTDTAGTWYMMTFDADTYAQLGSYTWVGSDVSWGGSFTIGIDSTTGTACYYLQASAGSSSPTPYGLYVFDRNCNLVTSANFTTGEPDPPFYFALSQ